MVEMAITAAEKIPYWIPKEIFLPNNSNNISVSSSFSTSSKDLSPDDDPNPVTGRVGYEDTDDDDDDVSSSWSLSTTSDLTNPSLGVANIPVAVVRNSPPHMTKEDALSHRLAVEAAYNDLELEAGGIRIYPSNQVVQELSLMTPMPLNECTIHSQQQDIVDEEDEEEPLFDPFLLHHSEADESIFTDYYSHVELCLDDNGIRDYVPFSSSQHTDSKIGMGNSVPTTTSSVEQETPQPTLNKTNSCTPSRRQRMMARQQQQRRHSDLTSNASSSRRKRRVLVPLHARMEMIQHQSQKPIRTASRAIWGSVQRLHGRMMRPLQRSNALVKNGTSSSLRNIFRRNSKMDPEAYQCGDASVASSLPDLRNIDSEETDRTLPPEYGRTMAMNGHEKGEEDYEGEEVVYPVQFSVEVAKVGSTQSSPGPKITQPSITTTETTTMLPSPVTPPRPLPPSPAPITPINQDEDGDLRWLFARQQLPLSIPVHARVDKQFEESKVGHVAAALTLVDI
ncbi:hypothetical protein IV203_037713 [Nitzschia inconspicua]|uniref:Uncharacterized protein n=1 Tax=Nitzschia inconspicua TaxID=303405 RepID=A0A9K3PYU3_9STRA|nr:hypothetical protein IV203_037713 [Nitzschia inconspicua]